MEHPQSKPSGGVMQISEEEPEEQYCLSGQANGFACQRAVLETQINLWGLHLHIIFKPKCSNRQKKILWLTHKNTYKYCQ